MAAKDDNLEPFFSFKKQIWLYINCVNNLQEQNIWNFDDGKQRETFG